MTDSALGTPTLTAQPRVPAPPILGPRPVLDRECADALEAVRDQLPIAVTVDTIPVLRASAEAQDSTDEELRRGGTYTVFEREVPGPPDAPDITVLISLPVDRPEPVAAIYHIHGGGMVAGNRRSATFVAADLAAAAGMAMVSVEYRLAPEHPDPAPIEDCYAGLKWTAEHAVELGIDPDRIVVMGVSAGGGLAAGLALLARDRNGPALFAQMLLTPMLDDRNDTASAIQMEGVGVWDRVANRTGWQALLGERQGGPQVSPYASPARAEDLSGLPPALIDVGSAETFRDEAVDYASRIWQAGGTAELHVWPGGFHGYEIFAPEAAITRATIDERHRWLARLLR